MARNPFRKPDASEYQAKWPPSEYPTHLPPWAVRWMVRFDWWIFVCSWTALACFVGIVVLLILGDPEAF